jgi:hypothetical protein
VTAENPITEFLTAPLGPDWTVEELAEKLLTAIASRPAADVQEFALDADATSDRQCQRVLRPLLACLATKSAAEAGTSPNLYEGRLSFQRPGPEGPVWILGQFENRPAAVRVALRRSSSPLPDSEPGTVPPPGLPDARSHPDASQSGTGRAADEVATRT